MKHEEQENDIGWKIKNQRQLMNSQTAQRTTAEQQQNEIYWILCDCGKELRKA
jgi:hypothetical protein